jgi:pyrimidine-nucleoside phosphorylase
VSVHDPRAIVARKRDGAVLDAGEIHSFVEGYGRGDVEPELAAAFLMAVYLRGMSPSETTTLTRAYVDSGTTVSLASVDRSIVDKHSTGGVGDDVTLIFAPLAAALGLAVAKVSGRGLGHTGGTIDKLESIPGMRTDLSPDEVERQVEDIGCAIVGQRADLVPADGAFYALRHATATVESVPLIAASVMSKKLAVRSDLILLDVKAGRGAFMETVDAAAELAGVCVDIARASERAVRAVVTDMSQPLGHAVGNALEVREAVDVLAGGKGSARLRELSVLLAAEALATLSNTVIEEARARAERALDSGDALERFRAMVAAQGGDPRVADDAAAVLPAAPVVLPVTARDAGTIGRVDPQVVARTSAGLGAGRRGKQEDIDPAVGIEVLREVGDIVGGDDELARVHAPDEDAAHRAVDAIRSAFTLEGGPVQRPPLVLRWVG